MNLPEQVEILIITLSDRAFRGEYEDLSGPVIRKLISDYFKSENWETVIEQALIPDNASVLKDKLIEAGKHYNIIITTGGTGIGPRDITVETVKPLLDKEIPGIMEFIRIKYGTSKPNALLSRSVAGILGRSLVYTLPGSVRAVEEYMTEILKTLKHLIYMQYGIDTHQKN
jgi:molybdenum cofactor synthesis domain-containing protein